MASTVRAAPGLARLSSLTPYTLRAGLIRWKFVIHMFVDGFSRAITGLHVATNNRADTVLDLFVRAIQDWGVPRRIRGDRGTENLAVANAMENAFGVDCAPFIVGRYCPIFRMCADLLLTQICIYQECPQHSGRASLG